MGNIADFCNYLVLKKDGSFRTFDEIIAIFCLLSLNEDDINRTKGSNKSDSRYKKAKKYFDEELNKKFQKKNKNLSDRIKAELNKGHVGTPIIKILNEITLENQGMETYLGSNGLETKKGSTKTYIFSKNIFTRKNSPNHAEIMKKLIAWSVVDPTKIKKGKGIKNVIKEEALTEQKIRKIWRKSYDTASDEEKFTCDIAKKFCESLNQNFKHQYECNNIITNSYYKEIAEKFKKNKIKLEYNANSKKFTAITTN